MIGSLLTTAKFGWAAVSGVDAFADALAQYSVKMVLKSRDIDRDSAERIVSLAQAAVPQDTGLLFSGITATLEGDVWTVQASAVHGRGSWYDANYAFLVEKGTQSGIRGGRRGGTVNVEVGGRSRAGTFNPTTGRRYRVANANRRSERTHPGTKPQPFFYPAVDEVMGERADRLSGTIEDDL